MDKEPSLVQDLANPTVPNGMVLSVIARQKQQQAQIELLTAMLKVQKQQFEKKLLVQEEQIGTSVEDERS